MKLILSLAALLFAAPFVRAQVVVTNPISDILSQTNRADSERQEQALREERQALMEEGVKRYSEVFKLESSAPKFPTSR